MHLITMLLSVIGFFTFALAAGSAAGSAALPFNTSAAANDLPHKLVPFQYSGKLGGHEVQLNGTVQQIYTQMQQLYPDFKPNITATIPSNSSSLDLTSLSAIARRDDLTLQTRDLDLQPRNKGGVICCPVPGQPWQPANIQWIIIRDIWYLETLDRCPVAAQACTKIACYAGASVVLCNDNPYPIQPSCKYLVSYVWDIMNCPRHSQAVICGQNFDTDRYNVIVREDLNCFS